MIETVMFDMDGTVLDTLEDLTDSINHTLRALGYPERRQEEIRAFLGNGSRVLVSKALGGSADEETVDRAFRLYRAWYSEHAAIKTAPYEGVCALMKALRESGRRVAIASNKPEPIVKKLCERHFSGLIDICVGDVETRRRKPCPDMIEYALWELGAAKDGAVYVGDTEVDIATARSSGMPCISVGWGFRSKEELRAAGAETIADTVDELSDLLLGKK